MTLSGLKALATRLDATIDGERLEYVLGGRGQPTIVLINGAGGPIDGWHKVFESLTQLGMVVAYNRPGVGGSSKPTSPQTGDRLVRCLRALLAHTGAPAPYLLVGHSVGGLIANLFARSFPGEISGVVLLDATAPDDVAELARYESVAQRWLKRGLDAVFGRNPNAETEHLATTVESIEGAGPFPPVPLVVVSGAKPALAWATPAAAATAARAAHQLRLVALSPQGKQVVASRSGHFPQFTEPDLVVAAVREAISGARS